MEQLHESAAQRHDSMAVFDRALGALLGQAAGDALGTTVEFESRQAIARRYPQGLREIVGGGPFGLKPGQITDDTELALARPKPRRPRPL
ncbi:MAG: ADP-ribosylglycohydrolase family protein [Myxococcales bacterium]|jgi:ADP-ribosyl-[dinitrogen reductase] hydrolase